MQDFVQGFTLQCGHPPKAILLYNQDADSDPRIRILAGFGSVEPDPKKTGSLASLLECSKLVYSLRLHNV